MAVRKATRFLYFSVPKNCWISGVSGLQITRVVRSPLELHYVERRQHRQLLVAALIAWLEHLSKFGFNLSVPIHVGAELRVAVNLGIQVLLAVEKVAAGSGLLDVPARVVELLQGLLHPP